MLLQIVTKNIRWRALMETYQTAKFDCSPNKLSRDIVLTDRCPEKRKTRKTAGTAENPARQQTPFCDIQMVVILLLANISYPYRYPTTENLSDLDFDLSRSLKVKSDGVIRLAI